MTIQEKAIEQLERISEHLSAIGEKEDYTDIAIKALDQRWIPVSERLPETDGRYYVTIFNHLPCVSNKTSVRILDFWVDGVDFHGTTVYWGFYSGFSTSEIIAWMPLPEPYKECRADDE